MIRELEDLCFEGRYAETVEFVEPGEDKVPERPHWGLSVLQEGLYKRPRVIFYQGVKR